MAQLSPEEFVVKWHALFADNSTRDISEQDMRNFVTDLTDSFASLLVDDDPDNYDDWTALGEYYIDNKVTEDDRIYRSLTGTSGSPNVGNQPSLSPANWEEVSKSEGADLDFLSINPTTAVVLNMGNRSQRVFASSLTISGAKAWSVTGDDNALFIPSFTFNITAGSAQTLPAGSKVVGPPSAISEVSGGVWTPLVAGYYKASAAYDGSVWVWTIEGPST